MASEFTHLDPLGRARMVDVTAKDPTHRRAVARCRIYMEPETAGKIASGAISKGDVLAVARIAGIQAAKQTSNLLPLCHPLLVGSVFVNFRLEERHVEVETQVDTVDRTGVEMEALTAVRDRRADRLRHVQVRGPRHDHRGSRPLGEDGRSFRSLASAGPGRRRLRALISGPSDLRRGRIVRTGVRFRARLSQSAPSRVAGRTCWGSRPGRSPVAGSRLVSVRLTESNREPWRFRSS